MDEKDKQLCETTFAVESAKQAAKLGKDVASDIIRPTSKSIGENIGLLVDGVFDVAELNVFVTLVAVSPSTNTIL